MSWADAKAHTVGRPDARLSPVDDGPWIDCVWCGQEEPRPIRHEGQLCSGCVEKDALSKEELIERLLDVEESLSAAKSRSIFYQKELKKEQARGR